MKFVIDITPVAGTEDVNRTEAEERADSFLDWLARQEDCPPWIQSFDSCDPAGGS